jgi:hypothetical protein
LSFYNWVKGLLNSNSPDPLDVEPEMADDRQIPGPRCTVCNGPLYLSLEGEIKWECPEGHMTRQP